MLHTDTRHEVWCLCGREPREDLGEDRTVLERARYRARLNKLRDAQISYRALIGDTLGKVVER